MWKSLVKKQYSDPLEYQRFMGHFSSLVGISTCIVIFFGVHVIRILGWKVGAQATPVTMAILGIPFFSCIFMGLDSPARLRLAVTVGTIQSLLSKTSKYALFDPTTQMAYIPLDEESKVKGKARSEEPALRPKPMRTMCPYMYVYHYYAHALRTSLLITMPPTTAMPLWGRRITNTTSATIPRRAPGFSITWR